MKIRPFLFAALLLATVTACKHNNNGADTNGATSLPDSDYVNGTPLPQRDEGVSFMGSNVDRNRFQPVHFAFDSYTVSGEESGRVQEVAGFLQNGSKRVIVAGFCDERGTAEYNRALGEKRAEAVRDALIADGGRARAGADGELRLGDAGRSVVQRERVGAQPPGGVRDRAVNRCLSRVGEPFAGGLAPLRRAHYPVCHEHGAGHRNGDSQAFPR